MEWGAAPFPVTLLLVRNAKTDQIGFVAQGIGGDAEYIELGVADAAGGVEMQLRRPAIIDTAGGIQKEKRCREAC